MTDIADQQEINRLNAKVEALEAEVESVRSQYDAYRETAHDSQMILQGAVERLANRVIGVVARAEKMREALVKLAGFDHPTEQKIAIARAALDGDK